MGIGIRRYRIMDIKELRIGNYIHNNVESFPIKQKDLVFLIAFDNSHYAEPVALTDQWLISFGGEIRPLTIGIILDRFRLIWKDAYKYWYVIDNETQCYMTKIEFVHELQNFYKVMNGVELEFKEL